MAVPPKAFGRARLPGLLAQSGVLGGDDAHGIGLVKQHEGCGRVRRQSTRERFEELALHELRQAVDGLRDETARKVWA